MVSHLIMQSIHGYPSSISEHARYQFYYTPSLKYKSQFQLTPAVFTHSCAAYMNVLRLKLETETNYKPRFHYLENIDLLQREENEKIALNLR